MADESPVDTVDAAEPGAASPAAPLAGDWRAALPPDLVGEKSFERYRDVGGLAKAHLELERRLGAPLTPPGPDAKPEQLAAYRQRLGLPESPDKYELELAAPPEGSDFQWDPQWVGRLKQAGHSAHMSAAQIRVMADLYQEYMHSLRDRTRAQQVQEEQGELDGAVKVLEQKWGPRNGPQWRHHQARAETALNTLLAEASEADRQEVRQLANHPAVAHALSQMADGLIERGFVDGQEIPAGLSASDAGARIEAMRTAATQDPNHPLVNRRHPDHERVAAQYLEWQRIEAGDGSQYRRYPTR